MLKCCFNDVYTSQTCSLVQRSSASFYPFRLHSYFAVNLESISWKNFNINTRNFLIGIKFMGILAADFDVYTCLATADPLTYSFGNIRIYIVSHILYLGAIIFSPSYIFCYKFYRSKQINYLFMFHIAGIKCKPYVIILPKVVWKNAQNIGNFFAIYTLPSFPCHFKLKFFDS